MKRGSDQLGIRTAALFQFGSKYVSMGAQLVITAVLARLIAAEDFGLVAIVTVFTGLFSLLSDMGVGVAIVQYRELSEDDYGALFGFSILLAAALTFAFCLASPLIAHVYGDSRLVGLCLAAAPLLTFSTLNMVPSGLMLKARKFDVIGLRLVCATVVSGAAAIIAAANGAGCLALIFQSTLSAAIVLVWNLIARPVRNVSFHFAAPLKLIFSYSVYQFAFSVINYMSRNLDNMLIGKFMGSTQLGYYDKAYKLTGYPLSAFSSVIGSVVQPFMAEHQDDPDYVFAFWQKIEKLLSLVGVCVACIFFVASSEIVDLFYGSGWGMAKAPFSILAISVYFQMMGNPSGAFFQSLGRTDYMFKVGVINTLITLAGLSVGLLGGSIFTVACGVAVAYCLHMASIVWYLIHKCFGKNIACLGVFLPEIVVGLLASALVVLVFGTIVLPVALSFILKTGAVILLLLLGYAITGQLGYLREFKK